MLPLEIQMRNFSSFHVPPLNGKFLFLNSQFRLIEAIGRDAALDMF